MKRGYKQTEVGVIPEEWEIRNIGTSMRLINGCAFKPSDWKARGLPIIRIQNLNDPNAEFNYCDTAVEEKYYINQGDLLFAWSGTTGTSFGARIWNGPKGILNQHIFKVIPDPMLLTPYYAFLLLLGVQAEIEKKAHGFKASFVHVKKGDLIGVELPIPPIAEQRAIAAALGDIDALIAGLDQLIAKKRDLKQAAMQQLLTGQRRLPGFRGEWAATTIGECVAFSGGGQPPKSTFSYKPRPDYIRLIQIRDYKTDDFATYVPSSMAPKRCSATDIMIGRYGPPIFQILRGIEGAYNVALMKATPSPLLDNDYLYYFLQQECLFRLMELLSRRSSGQTGVDLAGLRQYPLSLPPLPEQTAIAAVLSDMDAEIVALEQRLQKTRALKQGMMQELLTGRTRLV